jgi:hypothetical protein
MGTPLGLAIGICLRRHLNAIYALTEALLELRSTKALVQQVRRGASQERHWSGHMSAISEQPAASYV